MTWRNCDGASTKFKQLKGGGLKCLHPACNGEKPMPSSRAKKHRNTHDERKRPRREVKTQFVKEELRVAYPGICMMYDCPHCDEYVGSRLMVGTTPKCPKCGKHFKVGSRYR